jgi:hypothetical protein
MKLILRLRTSDRSGSGMGRLQTESKLKKKWQKADLPEGIILNNPEAVSLIKKKNESAAHYLLLISDDGAEKPSFFVLIPLAKLE